ncbi:hypothetical protein BIY22_19610 [Vibrio panuliri]|uniref:Diguanylate cyclase n=2 Tax=Vibrio panuliri TaxID=1381081 RepID=A0A1Q9HHG4_9VIBR|nr:hypothetical protein BIY22_19610 [Vibrio panuliri]
MKRLVRISRNMLVLWLGLTLIPLLYYWYVSSKTQDEMYKQLQTQGLQFLSFVDERAQVIYSEIEKTTYEISHSSLLHDFAHSYDPRLKDYLEKQWYIASLNSSRFDQLRFIDMRGDEVIRVDYPNGSEQPHIVTEAQLQNKAHRDYFLKSQQLKTNQTGYVGIDLEYEHGKVVLPYKPGFRIIYPLDYIHKSHTERLGYFVANLDVLQLIDEITQNTQNLPVDFIDQAGFYLLSTRTDKLFGHLINEREHHQIGKEYPALWKLIQSQPAAGSYLADDGLYVYRTVQTPLFNHVSGLTLVTFYPQSLFAKGGAARFELLLLEVGIIWLALGLGAGIFTMMFETYRRSKIDHAFTNLLVESSSAIVLTDSHFNILRANHRFLELTGYHHEQLLGEQLKHLQLLPISTRKLTKTLQAKRYWKGSIELRNANQDQLSCELEIRPLDPQQTDIHYFVHSFTDISVHRKKIAELQTLSECDSATNLWNKAKFEVLLSEQAKLISRYKNHPPSCLAIIDIDDFKSINDSRGHAFGDQAILFVSSKLRQIMRDSDVIGRIGGDEFAMIIQHVDAEKAQTLMRRVNQEIARWTEYPISISVGIAPITDKWRESYERADNALYHAKASGRNCVVTHGINNVTSIDHHSA